MITHTFKGKIHPCHDCKGTTNSWRGEGMRLKSTARPQPNFQLNFRSCGPFLEGPEKFLVAPENAYEQNLKPYMITKLFCSYIPTMNRGSLHIRSFGLIRLSFFRFRLILWKLFFRARNVSGAFDKPAPVPRDFVIWLRPSETKSVTFESWFSLGRRREVSKWGLQKLALVWYFDFSLTTLF